MLGLGISSYSSGSSDDSSLRIRLSKRSDNASMAISRLQHNAQETIKLAKLPKAQICFISGNEKLISIIIFFVNT
jgi:hypothetical protein